MRTSRRKWKIKLTMLENMEKKGEIWRKKRKKQRKRGNQKYGEK